MPLSTAAKNAIINNLTGRQINIFSGTIYLGLSTTEPTVAGDGVTEPFSSGSTDTGYERVLLGTYGSSATYKMAAASNGSSKNNTAILFPRAKTNWGTIRYAVFFTESTGGTFIGWSPLTEAKTVYADYVANFDKNAITISLIDA